jgi:ubiquinone/menaquinone biosynthesis C-methylase UbiE
MAESDLVVKAFVVRMFFPCCVVIFGLYILKRNSKRISSVVSAYLLNKSVPLVNKATKQEKKKLFSELLDQRREVGRNLMILEIGAGGGANFEFYPPKSNVTCLDPNRCFNKYIENNSKKYKLHVNYVKGYAENMTKVEDDMYDAVVCTLVLCSVKNVSMSLREVQRVLKPVSFYLFQ